MQNWIPLGKSREMVFDGLAKRAVSEARPEALDEAPAPTGRQRQPALEFRVGDTAASLKITGRERFDILGMGATLRPRGVVTVRVTCEDGTIQDVTAIARIDTPEELVAFRHGGILPYVVRQLLKS